MKKMTIAQWFAGVLSAATIAAAAGNATADELPGFPPNEQEFKGTIENVHQDERILDVKGLTTQKTFNLAANCAIFRWDHTPGSMADLLPGAKVTVGYQDLHGVLTADRVEQEPLRFADVVKPANPTKGPCVLFIGDGNKGAQEVSKAPSTR